MQPLNALSNNVSRLPAQAIQTRAHGFSLSAAGLTEGNAASKLSKLRISNPSLLSAGWSNPNPSLSQSMNDGKCPLCLELNYISIWDSDAYKRVDHFDVLLGQDQFGSNPKSCNDQAQEGADSELNGGLEGIFDNQKTVRSEESKQHQRHTSPDKIASGAKSFIHLSIIAGDTK